MNWWSWIGSDRRPSAFEASALWRPSVADCDVNTIIRLAQSPLRLSIPLSWVSLEPTPKVIFGRVCDVEGVQSRRLLSRPDTGSQLAWTSRVPAALTGANTSAVRSAYAVLATPPVGRRAARYWESGPPGPPCVVSASHAAMVVVQGPSQ
jgi:hypothetical protein